MVEIGTWKNFDDLESCLILDELLLLIDSLGRKHKNNFRMLAAAQGYDIPDDDEVEDSSDDSDLPPELIAAERELAKKKEQLKTERDTSPIVTNFGTGLGYESVAQNILDQSVI